MTVPLGILYPLTLWSAVSSLNVMLEGGYNLSVSFNIQLQYSSFPRSSKLMLHFCPRTESTSICNLNHSENLTVANDFCPDWKFTTIDQGKEIDRIPHWKLWHKPILIGSPFPDFWFSASFKQKETERCRCRFVSSNEKRCEVIKQIFGCQITFNFCLKQK